MYYNKIKKLVPFFSYNETWIKKLKRLKILFNMLKAEEKFFGLLLAMNPERPHFQTISRSGLPLHTQDKNIRGQRISLTNAPP